MLGRTIQNYRVEELLGEGGMGTVYKASDTVLRRPVAVKMLHNHLVRDTTFMERFRNEAILSAQLNHPNVTTLYNFFQDHNDTIIIMELVNGVTVEKFLKQHGQLNLETAVRIVMQTLEGLQHAHSRGILHRDIKAANLMLTPEGTVKLMDFGIARLEGSTRLTRADRVVGTLEYMAPELLNCAEPSVQSDIYAVGVLLYELLSGKMPFESSTDVTLISQILTKRPISIKSRIPNLPRSVEDILEKLLQKNPEKRFRKSSELRQALASIVPAGNIDTELFFTAPTPATQLSERRSEKPQPAPTRLATGFTELENHDNSNPFWTKFKANVWSLEGAILIGALILASGIISVWSFSGSPDNSDNDKGIVKVEATIPHPRLTAKDSAKNNQFSAGPSVTFVSQDEPQKPLEEIPDDIPASTPVVRKKKTTQQNKPLKEVPVEVAEPVKSEKEIVPAPSEKPERKIALELKGETLAAEFAQNISTEESHAGQTFWLNTISPLIVNGITVVRSGARVRGQIDRVLSKAANKRSGLWFHLESVETVDGQWLPLNLRWDDTAFHALELKKGFTFKRIKIEKMMVNVSH